MAVPKSIMIPMLPTDFIDTRYKKHSKFRSQQDIQFTTYSYDISNDTVDNTVNNTVANTIIDISNDSIANPIFMQGFVIRCYESDYSERHSTAIILKDGKVLDVTNGHIQYDSVNQWLAIMPPTASYYVNCRNAIDQALKNAKAIYQATFKKQTREYKLICDTIKQTAKTYAQ